MLKYLFCL